MMKMPTQRMFSRQSETPVALPARVSAAWQQRVEILALKFIRVETSFSCIFAVIYSTVRCVMELRPRALLRVFRQADIEDRREDRGWGQAMLRAISCAVAALIFWLPPASAQQASPPSRLDAIIAAGVLKVGSTGDYKPFTFKDPATGTFSGFDIDQAQSLAAALGVKVEMVPTAWPNLMKDFEAGAFDVAMGGVSVTLDRQKKGLFSIPYMHEGKTPIARCVDKSKFASIADIDKAGVTVITNPGGTNEKFDRANFKSAAIVVFADNTKIFDELAAGKADLMITDASETRYQQKMHPGVLCAIHPDQPFDFAEKAYWLQRDWALKAFVDQWLHQSIEGGAYHAIYAKWFD
jgi:cyclohexadienyl dehydratase